MRYFKVINKPNIGFGYDLTGLTLKAIKDMPELEGKLLHQPKKDANGKPMAEGGTVTIDNCNLIEVDEPLLNRIEQLEENQA